MNSKQGVAEEQLFAKTNTITEALSNTIARLCYTDKQKFIRIRAETFGELWRWYVGTGMNVQGHC